MRTLVKGVIPGPILRHVRAVLTSRNQQKLLQACERGKEIRIKPDNRVEHYFHFLFDLTLPLWRLMAASPPDVTFALQPFGIFTPRLEQLFPGRVRIEDADEAGSPLRRERLLGMNPQFVHLSYRHLEAFKQHVLNVLEIDANTPRDQVLLIERLPPNEYFAKHAVKRGAGASRRSIPNHDELAEAIRSMIEAPFEFHNVQLENMPFAEQVRLFDRAALVIGQHGAGLANCLWTRPGSQVVELTHNPSLAHFQCISSAMGHQHFIHRTAGNHAPVDVNAIVALIRSSVSLSC